MMTHLALTLKSSTEPAHETYNHFRLVERYIIRHETGIDRFGFASYFHDLFLRNRRRANW